jgi:DNA-binding Xre family transcriptional regulator
MSKSKKWTIAGEPLADSQIKTIKASRKSGERRSVIEPTASQAKAIKKRAALADAEARAIMSEMQNCPEFCKTIRSRRIELEMTLEQLAEATGISKANLSRLEWGRTTNPTLDTLRRVGDALGLTLTVEYSTI